MVTGRKWGEKLNLAVACSSVRLWSSYPEASALWLLFMSLLHFSQMHKVPLVFTGDFPDARWGALILPFIVSGLCKGLRPAPVILTHKGCAIFVKFRQLRPTSTPFGTFLHRKAPDAQGWHLVHLVETRGTSG